MNHLSRLGLRIGSKSPLPPCGGGLGWGGSCYGMPLALLHPPPNPLPSREGEQEHKTNQIRLFSTKGFGLLEAIVALALFAGVGMAVFAWINTSLSNANRLQETEVITRCTSLATEWLQTVNPAEHDRGEVLLSEGVRLRWQARAATPRIPGAPFPGGTSTPFELALFAVEIQISHPQLRGDLELTMNRLGVWRQPVELFVEP